MLYRHKQKGKNFQRPPTKIWKNILIISTGKYEYLKPPCGRIHDVLYGYGNISETVFTPGPAECLLRGEVPNLVARVWSCAGRPGLWHTGWGGNRWVRDSGGAVICGRNRRIRGEKVPLLLSQISFGVTWDWLSVSAVRGKSQTVPIFHYSPFFLFDIRLFLYRLLFSVFMVWCIQFRDGSATTDFI
jgi:hypothetical protein